MEPGAGPAVVKAAWRRLARAHHPDLAADEAARDEATRRMAEINAAYEELRTPVRRRGTSWGPAGRGAPSRAAADDPGPGGPGATGGRPGFERPSGPPPDPPAPPVTARLDATPLFRPRNATTTPAGGGYRHHPRPRREPLPARPSAREERRASDPNGPLERSRPRRPPRRPIPAPDVAQAMEIPFGKFSGWSLGSIAQVEPTYLEWVTRTITRDPDLVAAARVVLAAIGRPAPD